MKVSKSTLMVIITFCLLSAPMAIGIGIPHLMNIQGILTDDEGTPVVDDIHNVDFSIYDGEFGGEALWSESRSVVTTNGVFSVILGEVNPIPASLFSGADLWLGMALTGSAEMEPRQRLTAVPYVYRALHTDSANFSFMVADDAITSGKIADGSIMLGDLGQNGAASGQVIKWNGSAWAPANDESGGGGGWVDDGSVVRLSSSGDYVGIGTSDPQEKLHVDGDIRLGSASDIAFGDDSTRIYVTGGDMVVTANDDLHLQPDDDIYIRADGGSAWVHFDNSVERLGIGATNPVEKLDVDGNIRVGLNSAIKFGGDVTRMYGSSGDLSLTADDDIYLRPDDDIYVRADGGTDWVRFDNGTNRLGVGTTSPTHRLTVNGELAIQNAGVTKYHLGYYNGGLNFSETTVADYRINIEDGGNVGIGTGNPEERLHVAGNAKINDTLTAGAIFSTSIVDEPGVAAKPRPGYLDLTTAWQTVIWRSISIPGPGYVIAMASGHIWMDHHYGDNDYAYAGIADNITSPLSKDEIYMSLGSSVGGGDFSIPIANLAVFEVTSRSYETYYYLAKISADLDAFIEHSQLILLYVPTAYGVVDVLGTVETTASPTTSAEDRAIHRQGQTSLPADGSMDAVLAELTSLRQQLAELKQQLGAGQ